MKYKVRLEVHDTLKETVERSAVIMEFEELRKAGAFFDVMYEVLISFNAFVRRLGSYI